MERWFCVAVAVGLLASTTIEFSSHAMQTRAPVDVSSLGPQVGQLVPNFNLSDQNGRVWTRDSILGPNGAILLFHRSADW